MFGAAQRMRMHEVVPEVPRWRSLIMAIATINVWNRIAITTRATPAHRPAATSG